MTDTHDGLHPVPPRILDFYIVGGPKCGTTSLFDWLSQHPGTHLVGKEPNFLSRDVFDARGLPGSLQTWDDYLTRLLPPPESGRIAGEATPRYLYSDRALEILARHPARPRIIAVLRNPIDLVRSLHGQMLRQGVETETDFATAWDRALARGADPEAWRDAQGRIDRRLDYPMFGLLGVRIARLCAAIPAERRRILILEEEMSTDPAAAIAMLLDFLGLEPVTLDLARQNTAVELQSIRLNRLIRKLRAAVERLRGTLGMDVFPARSRKRGTGLLRLINRFNLRVPAPGRSLDPALRGRLARYFAEDVALLRATLDQPIPAWTDWPVRHA